MNWDDLRYIRALGLDGTLGSASSRLGMHPSTLLRRLNQIEAGLGVRLFDRHREGLSPTAAGEEAIETAERLAGEFDELERRLAGRDTTPTGTVRLTTTDTLVQGVLGPMIADFSRRYPGIHLEVVAANPFFSLSKRDADIALRPTRSPPESLVGRKITDVATAVYGATAYLAKSPSRQALEAHIWVAPDDSLAHLPSAQWLRKQLPTVSPVVRCNGVAGMLAAARAGVGLAALPCFLGDAAAELERVREPLPELTVGLWLLTHRDLRRVPRIRAVIDHLHKSLEEHRPQFLGTARGE